MITKDDILVIKNNTDIIIVFNGIKLIKPIGDFENMSEQDIIEWFLKEVNSS